MRIDHGDISESKITIRFEVHRHIEKIVLVLNERVQYFKHEWLRKSTSEATHMPATRSECSSASK